VLERDGLKGSLAKFGSSVGFVRFANVPCSEGMVILILSQYYNLIAYKNFRVCC